MNDDLISRQAVRLIESDHDAYPQEWNDDYEKGFADCLEKVLALPSIDAVKHGRWIRTTKADYAWECSACGNGLCDNRTTYCYDCGARMDGEENG